MRKCCNQEGRHLFNYLLGVGYSNVRFTQSWKGLEKAWNLNFQSRPGKVIEFRKISFNWIIARKFLKPVDENLLNLGIVLSSKLLGHFPLSMFRSLT